MIFYSKKGTSVKTLYWLGIGVAALLGYIYVQGIYAWAEEVVAHCGKACIPAHEEYYARAPKELRMNYYCGQMEKTIWQCK